MAPNDAPKVVKAFWSDVYSAWFAMVSGGGGAGVLGYGQDRVGPRGQALNRSRPAGQVGVRGRPTDRSKGSTRGCGSRLAGQAAPGARGASRAGGGRPRGRRSV